MEDSSIASSAGPNSKHSPSRQYDKPNGYVNLTSVYTTPVLERAILTKTGEQYNKNGYLEQQQSGLGSPTKSEKSANTSFLYSQLLSPQKKALPIKDYADAGNFQSTSIYANLLNESLANSANVDYNNGSPNTLGSSPLNKLSFTSGINKISDNYEKAISNVSQKEMSAMNRLGIFKKDGNGAKGFKKSKTEEDDEADYARDSDECSI